MTNEELPAVEITAGVEATYRHGPWEITATWPQRSRRTDVSTVMRVMNYATDPPQLVLSSTRVNLYSNSGKSQVAMAMRKHSQFAESDRVVHWISEHLLEQYRQAGYTEKPQPRQQTGATDLLYPIWPATEGTIIGAATNSYKSWIALAAAVQVSLGVEILQGNTYCPTPTPVLYLDWEVNEAVFSERLYAILKAYGLPLEPCVAYRKMTTPLSDAADAIRDEILRNQYGGVTIDSLSAAVGGSLNEDEPANDFWNAVAYLETPALVTAHKSDEAIRKNRAKVFGSVMHQNRPRMIWDARRETDSPLVAWTVANDNNTGRKGMQLAWRIQINTTGEHHERRLDTVTFTAVNPNDVRQAPNEGQTLADQIAYTLTETGPLTHGEIAMMLGAKPDSVKAQLHRHKHLFTKRDLRWEITK